VEATIERAGAIVKHKAFKGQWTSMAAER